MSRRRRSQAPVLVGGTAVIAIIGGLALLSPYLFRSLRSPQIARDLNNLRQVKIALDGFATDFDGLFPNRDTAWTFHALRPTEPRSANDLFRQLFFSGELRDERIFHLRGSPACSAGGPDGDLGEGGVLDRSRILAAGENGWSYFEGLTNASAARHPLVLGAFAPDGSLQNDVWDSQALVLTVDGSARARSADPDGIVRDLEGADLARPGNTGAVFRDGFTPILWPPASPERP